MSSPEATDPAPSEPSTLAVPGYTIGGAIAQSGLTTVYYARESQFWNAVAIKVHQFGVDPERLVSEARITAQLPHPGIVPVHSLGTLPDGRPFMVMKLIRGNTLAYVLRSCVRPENHPRLLAVFEQVCQTLAYAHVCGMIHRNIKPSKVMIGMFGEVLLLGWGLARVLDEQTQPTQLGPHNIVGTPAYMPPEQARGEVADARSDVFGLGALLCEMLTDEPPFTDSDAMELIRRSAAGDLTTAFTRLDACGADSQLIALAKRCLAPNREDRPANAGVVACAVAELRVSVEERLRQAQLDHLTAELNAARQRGPGFFNRDRVQMLILVFLLAIVVLGFLNGILLLVQL